MTSMFENADGMEMHTTREHVEIKNKEIKK